MTPPVHFLSVSHISHEPVRAAQGCYGFTQRLLPILLKQERRPCGYALDGACCLCANPQAVTRQMRLLFSAKCSINLIMQTMSTAMKRAHIIFACCAAVCVLRLHLCAVREWL
jgi:hypothetical protein